MWSEWSQLAERHPIALVIGGIAVSLLWFLAGKQFRSEGRSNAAVGWQGVAVLIVLTVSGLAIIDREWLGFALAIAVFYVEVRSIRRMLA